MFHPNLDDALQLGAVYRSCNLRCSTAPDTRATQDSSVSVSPRVVKETEKALRALQQNKLDDGQQYLDNALRIDPTFRRKLSHRSIAAAPQKVPESHRLPAKILGAFPEPLDALLTLGEAQVFVEQHDYANAIASLEKFLSGQPRSPQAPSTQKYVNAMRKLLPQKTVGEVETLAVTDSSPSGADSTKAQVGKAGDADSALPPLPRSRSPLRSAGHLLTWTPRNSIWTPRPVAGSRA